MEAKQHASEQPTNCTRNKKRNQNMHRNEQKWKQSNPNPVGHCKICAKGKVHGNTGIRQEIRKKSNT